MKSAQLVAALVISCGLVANSQAGVVIGHGIAPGKGKPLVESCDELLDLGTANDAKYLNVQHLQLTSSSSTLAAGFSLNGLASHLTSGQLTSGLFNVYTFTVGSCIDSFVSSVLFGEEIAGLNFLNGKSAGPGVFVLGVQGKSLTFAGLAPFNKGFALKIYTTHTADIPALPASATPEPSTLLLWGGLVSMCGAARSLRRTY